MGEYSGTRSLVCRTLRSLRQVVSEVITRSNLPVYRCCSVDFMSHSLRTNRRYLPASSTRRLAIAAGVAGLVIALDAFSKLLVTQELGPQGSRSSIQIGGDFFELHYALNSGVAFGMLSGSSTVAGVLVGILIVPLVIVLIILAGRGKVWAIAAGLVLGGAAGNLIDRIGDHTVTDFISIGRWPSFNLADSAISVGAILLIGLSFRERDHDELTTGS